MSKQVPLLSLDQVQELVKQERSLVLCSSAVRTKVSHILPDSQVTTDLTQISERRPKTVIAIGGGALMDKIKLLKSESSPSFQLVCVPSLWGSGAENSAIVVNWKDGKRFGVFNQSYLPDGRAIFPELSDLATDEQIKNGCGDAITHALEAYLSPLASQDVRKSSQEALTTMVTLGVGRQKEWFELSAHACWLQSQASVGLIHGCAHVLEESSGLKHAKLCSLFLLPVMNFNLTSTAVQKKIAELTVEKEKLFSLLESLFDAKLYESIKQKLKEHWPDILSDPNTKTNAKLVRLSDLDFFLNWRANQ